MPSAGVYQNDSPNGIAKKNLTIGKPEEPPQEASFLGEMVRRFSFERDDVTQDDNQPSVMEQMRKVATFERTPMEAYEEYMELKTHADLEPSVVKIQAQARGVAARKEVDALRDLKEEQLAAEEAKAAELERMRLEEEERQKWMAEEEIAREQERQTRIIALFAKQERSAVMKLENAFQRHKSHRLKIHKAMLEEQDRAAKIQATFRGKKTRKQQEAEMWQAKFCRLIAQGEAKAALCIQHYYWQWMQLRAEQLRSQEEERKKQLLELQRKNKQAAEEARIADEKRKKELKLLEEPVSKYKRKFPHGWHTVKMKKDIHSIDEHTPRAKHFERLVWWEEKTESSGQVVKLNQHHIDIKDMTDVSSISTTEFQIKTPGSVYKFRCTSKDAVDVWVNTLRPAKK